MGFGTFIAHSSFHRVRISNPNEALAYAQALPAATQARTHWRDVIVSAENAGRTEALIDKARDTLRRALVTDRLFLGWSR